MGLKSFLVWQALTCVVVYCLEGECGDQLSWSYNNNQLSISGTGDMWDFSEDGSAGPSWLFEIPETDEYSVFIHGAVKSIGRYAFYQNKKVTSVQATSSLTSIGDFAFSGCSLTNFSFYNTNSNRFRGYIGKSAFSSSSLTSFAVTGIILGIDDNAFSDARSLSDVSITNQWIHKLLCVFFLC